MQRLFTRRKKVLSSAPPNAEVAAAANNKNVAVMTANPAMQTNNSKQLLNNYIASYKRKNLNQYFATLPKVKSLAAKPGGKNYIRSRLSRGESNVSALSNANLAEMLKNVEENRANLGGGRRRTRRNRSRRSRRCGC